MRQLFQLEQELKVATQVSVLSCKQNKLQQPMTGKERNKSKDFTICHHHHCHNNIGDATKW